MRIAIAGSRSLLATALKARCSAAGWDVALIGRGEQADIHFDALEPDGRLPELSGVACLVICAASFGSTTVSGMRENMQVNVLGTLGLLESALRGKVEHVTYVSSTSAIAGSDSYGLSKSTAEAMVRQLCTSQGVKHAILRPAQIYDTEGEAKRHQPFLYFLVDQLLAGKDVTLYGTKDVLRNYVHVDDVAEALVGCMRERLEGLNNAVHPQSLPVSEIAKLVRDGLGASGKISFDPSKTDMPEIEIPGDHCVFARLGLAPRAFGDGIKAIRAYRSRNGDRT